MELPFIAVKKQSWLGQFDTDEIEKKEGKEGNKKRE